MTATGAKASRRRAIAVAAALAVVLLGCGGSDDSGPARDSDTSPAQARQAAPQGATDIPELVDEVGPSVVAIAVETPQGAGEGSGIVWDDDGHIVTNHHVVEGARTVQVQSARGDRFEGRVVATDPRTDLGVVKLEDGELPAASFADGLPEVGSLAVAMGSPLGFENTVTAGIVSGLDRSLPTGGDEPSLVGLIQTDAAISPGNSGGALVGAGGRVIGINVAYLPPQETGAVAIGFAIPAPTVRDVVRQLVEDGQVDHPYLGVQLAAAAAGDEPVVVVLLVEPGGPAADAGIRPRDIITRIGDREVTMVEQVYEALRGRKPGDRVRVVVRRGGEERELDLELGQRPTPAAGALPGEGG